MGAIASAPVCTNDAVLPLKRSMVLPTLTRSYAFPQLALGLVECILRQSTIDRLYFSNVESGATQQNTAVVFTG